MIAAALFAAASNAVPQKAPSVADAVVTSVAACEAWVMSPATWADHIAQFPKRSALAGRGLQSSAGAPAFAAPPTKMRLALHGWAVPANGGKVWITTSDVRPFCHIASDLTGSIAATDVMTTSTNFAERWTREGPTQTDGGVISTTYRSTKWTSVVLVISTLLPARDAAQGVKMIASLQMELRK